MRILLLNLYYPPDTSATAKMAQAVAETLSEAHQVTILCGRPSYDPAERRPWRLWGTETSGRVTIIRVGSTDFPRFQMRRRVLNYLSYVALSVPRALLMRCDIILAMTDPPFEGIVGAFVALLKHTPYVYNVRDFYPDMAVGGSVIEPGLLSQLWERLHRWALRRVTRVVVLGEDMRTRVVSKGVRPERISIIRDGTDIFNRGGSENGLDAEVLGAIRGDFRFVLLHAGNLGFYGAWNSLITALHKLKDEGIGLVFVGDGAQRATVQQAADGLPNVRFLPFFPVNKIRSVLAAGDIHVVTIKRGLEGVIVPSKMYEILAAGKPILAAATKETDVASVCERTGCGVSCDPDRPEEIASTIRELAANPVRLQEMARAAKSAAAKYDRVLETRKFLQVVQEAAQA